MRNNKERGTKTKTIMKNKNKILLKSTKISEGVEYINWMEEKMEVAIAGIKLHAGLRER